MAVYWHLPAGGLPLGSGARSRISAVELQLIGQPHGGYYDERRVWHPRASPPSQVTYGLGVGATTIVGAGEAGATELAEGHPGQRVPGAKGTQGLLQVMRLQNEEARRSALSLS